MAMENDGKRQNEQLYIYDIMIPGNSILCCCP